MGIKELSELQGELDSLKEENEQMEDKLLMEHGLSREKVCHYKSEPPLGCWRGCLGNPVVCHHLLGGGGRQVAHGHQQSSGAVLPRCAWASAKPDLAVHDGHGEGSVTLSLTLFSISLSLSPSALTSAGLISGVHR